MTVGDSSSLNENYNSPGMLLSLPRICSQFFLTLEGIWHPNVG